MSCTCVQPLIPSIIYSGYIIRLTQAFHDIIDLDKLQTIYFYSYSVNDWLNKDIAAIMIKMVMSWLQRNIITIFTTGYKELGYM